MATLKVTNIKNESFAGDQLYLKTDGTIGIGTTSPANKLHVVGTTKLFGTTAIGGNDDITPSSDGVGQLTIDGNGYTGYIAQNATAMYFGHNSSSRDLTLQTNESDRLTIDGSTGNVGIGTTNPSFRLQIQGTDNAGSGLYLYNGTGGEGIKIVPESNGNCRIYSSTADALALGTDSIDRIFMKADGNVGIGTASPAVTLEVEKTIDVNWSAANSIIVANNLLRLENLSTNNSAFAGMQFRTGDGGDGFFGSYQNNSSANDCTFYWSNQTDSGAKTLATLDTASGDLTINDGDLVIGTAGHGIDFSAQTASSATGATTTSELLDHYEEGTWTPSYGGADSNPTCSYENQVGQYVRTGRIVTLHLRLRTDSVSGGSGTLKVRGLPFQASSYHGMYGGFITYTGAWKADSAPTLFHIGSSNNEGTLYKREDGNEDPSAMQVSDLNTTNDDNDLRLTAIYYCQA